MTTPQEIRLGSTAPTTLLASARGDALRHHSRGVQEGATPGTVDLLQLRTAETRIAKSLRGRLRALFAAEPCPQREGFPAPESTPAECATVAISAAAGTVLAAAVIFICGGAA